MRVGIRSILQVGPNYNMYIVCIYTGWTVYFQHTAISGMEKFRQARVTFHDFNLVGSNPV